MSQRPLMQDIPANVQALAQAWETSTTVEAEFPPDHKWHYRDQTLWADLCPLAGNCQSPIHILSADVQDSRVFFKEYEPLQCHYTVARRKVNLTARTLIVHGSFGHIELLTPSGNTRVFDSVQFHFHAPSEHLVNHEHHDLELHVVHREREANNLAVLGFLFKNQEKPDSFIKQVIEACTKPASLDLNLIVPSKLSYYTYKGSLTTPPLIEEVLWFLSSQVLAIDKSQLDFFTTKWADNPAFAEGKGNNREVQPLNGRAIVHFESAVQSEATKCL